MQEKDPKKDLGKKAIAVAIVTLVIGIALGYVVANSTIIKTGSNNDNIILSPENAEKDPEAYAPDTFYYTVISAHAVATGRVTSIMILVEGENETYHFLLLPDLQYRYMVNDGNIKHLSGALMIEVLLRDKGVLPKLHIGQHLEVEGPHILDIPNGWNEIHPATAIKEI